MQRSKSISLEKAFGDVVRKRRLAMSISQEELADRCALHRTYVSQIERGLKSISLKVLSRLAKALGTEPHLLMKQTEEELGHG